MIDSIAGGLVLLFQGVGGVLLTVLCFRFALAVFRGGD